MSTPTPNGPAAEVRLADLQAAYVLVYAVPAVPEPFVVVKARLPSSDTGLGTTGRGNAVDGVQGRVNDLLVGGNRVLALDVAGAGRLVHQALNGRQQRADLDKELSAVEIMLLAIWLFDTACSRWRCRPQGLGWRSGRPDRRHPS